MALFEIKNMSFTYNGSVVPALRGVTLDVESGDMVLLCGSSGCGKSTLLRLLKKRLCPLGEMEGRVAYNGVAVSELEDRVAATEIGYVMQSPDDQMVTDKVSRELAFGLESLGFAPQIIRRRVAEVCGFFGIGDLYDKSVAELSGGQKQLVLLASVMALQPSVIILDEPTAQLDPLSASELISHLKRINEELGVTVIIAEHRLEELFLSATKVVMIENGCVELCDEPRAVVRRLLESNDAHKMALGLPAAPRLFYLLGKEGECPLTVKEAKSFIKENYGNKIRKLRTEKSVEEQNQLKSAAIEIKDGYFRYERDGKDVLRGLTLRIEEGSITAILGANGVGKTTLLKVMAGTEKLYSGKYRVFGERVKKSDKILNGQGSIRYLPQDPKSVFVGESVEEELLMAASDFLGEEMAREAADEVARRLSLTHLAKRHPYDLSGGEMQSVALARLLLCEPRIILLDEPTKGMDALSKRAFAEIMQELRAEGKTIVIVSHDVEFCAEYADVCAMFFDGRIVSVQDRVSFFSENRYYTTAAARMTQGYYENAVTVEMAVELCEANERRLL